MQELNFAEIDQVSGGGLLDKFAIFDMVIDFCKGFASGVSAAAE